MSLNDYSVLTQYGDVFEMKPDFYKPDEFVKWTEDNFEYVRYNPRKKIARYGLSITSLDGGVSGVPDLDSLFEYNKEHGTELQEMSFNVPTPVYEHQGLKNCIGEWEEDMFRTHILRMDPGGYFPPHRDTRDTDFKAFRLIVPLKEVNPPNVNFVVDGKIINWVPGRMYFVNTAKVHYLFNGCFSPSYWLVLNIKNSERSVRRVLKSFGQY